jgi:hypothetical protein
MKKLFLMLLVVPAFANAQFTTEETQPKPKKDGTRAKNAFKINLSSLAFKNYHFMYERALGKKFSIQIAYRTMSKGSLPYQDRIKEQVFGDDPDISYDKMLMGNTAITPEIRFYMGRNYLKGVYFAPYARFSTFDLTVPVKYNGGLGQKEALFTGEIKSTSFGGYFGWQTRLGKILVLDLWIIGGHYGNSSGDLNATFTPALNGQERTALQDVLDNLDIKPFSIKGTIASDGRSATATSNGPWAGIRGGGFTLGFRL